MFSRGNSDKKSDDTLGKFKVRGRCIGVEPSEIAVLTLKGVVRLRLSQPSLVALGDVVEADSVRGLARTLTPNRRPAKDWPMTSRILDPRRLHATRVRSRVEAAIREFFLEQDFLETRTPILVPSPGLETHIRPFEVVRPAAGGATAAFLPTSPEFAMKRLLVGGLEKVFQICSSFRDEPLSSTHHPEFTMLEWYRSYAGYEKIMCDTEALYSFVALKLFGKSVLRFQGREIDVTAPWPRLRVRDLFLNLGVDLVASDLIAMRAHCTRLGLDFAEQDTWDDLYFRIWLNLIEPRLPADRAVFVMRYPPSQAALATIDEDPDGSRWARRFEFYAGGFELGNAFEELTDSVEQRKRFMADMDLRMKIYGAEFPKSPIDEEFLAALDEGLPPSGGIAIGVDRMVMLFADEPEIEKTVWLSSSGSFVKEIGRA